MASRSYLPTKKWWAALVTGASSIVVHAITTGAFDDVEEGQLLTLVSALVLAYLKRNDSTAGGVPNSTA